MKKHDIIFLLFLALLVFSFYWASVAERKIDSTGVHLLHDIAESDTVDYSPLRRLEVEEATSYWLRRHLISSMHSGTKARESYYPILPRVLLSVQWAFFQTEYRGYHAVNILLHLANVFLLFSLLLRFGFARNIVWTAAALYALHPSLVGAVGLIAGQRYLLAALFSLLALRLGLLPLFEENERRKRFPWVALLLFFFFALLADFGALALWAIVFILWLSTSQEPVREHLWRAFLYLTIIAGVMLFLRSLMPMGIQAVSMEDWYDKLLTESWRGKHASLLYHAFYWFAVRAPYDPPFFPFLGLVAPLVSLGGLSMAGYYAYRLKNKLLITTLSGAFLIFLTSLASPVEPASMALIALCFAPLTAWLLVRFLGKGKRRVLRIALFTLFALYLLPLAMLHFAGSMMQYSDMAAVRVRMAEALAREAEEASTNAAVYLFAAWANLPELPYLAALETERRDIAFTILTMSPNTKPAGVRFFDDQEQGANEAMEAEKTKQHKLEPKLRFEWKGKRRLIARYQRAAFLTTIAEIGPKFDYVSLDTGMHIQTEFIGVKIGEKQEGALRVLEFAFPSDLDDARILLVRLTETGFRRIKSVE